MWLCFEIHFQVKKSKVKVTAVIWNEDHLRYCNFFRCPLRGSVPIWLNHFICDTHTTHEGMMCLASFSGWKVQSQGRMGGWIFFYSVCSIAPSLFHRFTSFELHRQFMWAQYVNMHHCQVKRSNVKVTRSFAIFAMSPPYLPPYLSEWGYDVLHPISVTKDDRSRSNASFQVWPFFLPGFIPIWPNHFICGIHTTHEEVMCPIPFPGSKVKVTWVVSSFGPVHSVAHPYLTESLHKWHTHNTSGWWCVVHHFQDERSRSYMGRSKFTLFTVWLPPYCLVLIFVILGMLQLYDP